MGPKFKLEAVLNYRRSLTEQAQERLGHSLQSKARLEATLEQGQNALRQLDEQLKERQREGLSVAEIDLFEGQILHRRRQLRHWQQQLQELESQILAERQELLQAKTDLQVMEKLKEKKQAAYRQKLSRQERNLLDEVSLRTKRDVL